MKRRMKVVVAAALYFSAQTALAGEAVPQEGRGIEAVARVFVLAEHLFGADIVLNSTTEPPWSEAILLERGNEFFLKRRSGTRCTYDFAQANVDPTNRHEMVADMSRPLRSIAFDRLSIETETRFSDPYKL
jgi:hypothetical protein